MENVEARLEALELAIGELRLQLDLDHNRIRTMRLTHTCPACGGKHLLHFRRINEAEPAGLTPLSLNTRFRWGRIEEGDPLEVFGCRRCGLLEWYAPAINRVKPDGVNVVEIASTDPPTPEQGPYR